MDASDAPLDIQPTLKLRENQQNPSPLDQFSRRINLKVPLLLNDRHRAPLQRVSALLKSQRNPYQRRRRGRKLLPQKRKNPKHEKTLTLPRSPLPLDPLPLPPPSICQLQPQIFLASNLLLDGNLKFTESFQILFRFLQFLQFDLLVDGSGSIRSKMTARLPLSRRRRMKTMEKHLERSLRVGQNEEEECK